MAASSSPEDTDEVKAPPFGQVTTMQDAAPTADDPAPPTPTAQPAVTALVPSVVPVPAPVPTSTSTNATAGGASPRPSLSRTPSAPGTPGSGMSALAAMRAAQSESDEEITFRGAAAGPSTDADANAETQTQTQAETQEQTQDMPQTLLILVGLPGCGKSTFAHGLEQLPGRKWTRASQDDSVSKRRQEVEDTVRKALRRDENVVVDRVNFDADQRAHFIALARSLPLATPVRLAALVLWAPDSVLRSRLETRQGHPTLKDPETALKVLGSMKRSMVYPDLSEGFDRVLVLRDAWAPEDVGAVMERLETEGRNPSGSGPGFGGRGRGRGRGGVGMGGGRGSGSGFGSGFGRGMPGGDRGRGSDRGRRRAFHPNDDRSREASRGGYRGGGGRGGYAGPTGSVPQGFLPPQHQQQQGYPAPTYGGSYAPPPQGGSHGNAPPPPPTNAWGWQPPAPPYGGPPA